jgi:3-methyl-2-oxobutanoate hydroxymethyltransferase
MKKVTLNALQAHKAAKEKFATITAYDALFAGLIEQAGIEVIMVGDSLGMVLEGRESTLAVNMDTIVYHTQCVNRGTDHTFIITDMPFGSYFVREHALENAARLLRAGAHMVKLEGGQWLLKTINALTERGIPVCAHLGLTPQSVNMLSGFKAQGRDSEAAQAIFNSACEVEEAGAKLLVLECVPSELGKRVAKALTIPVIGIGAGADVDAQVLVLHDMLGLAAQPARFVRNFLADTDSIQQALASYNTAVKDGSFPAAEHSFS